mgnify:CR=1 FL=1
MSTFNGKRIYHLDLLRGFAVLGLLLMNLPGMGMPEIGYVRFEPDLLGDKIVAGLQALFFDGRFRNLFCLLFGIGLYLQYQSYQRINFNSYIILKSRLNWLLVFGIIHCVFIWPGDILIFYALTGMYLQSKLDWPAQKLIKRGLLFFTIGLVILCLEFGISLYFEQEHLTRGSQDYLDSLAIINSSYWEILIMNAILAFAYILTFPILSLFYFSGIMLLAVGLFKSGKLQQGFTKQECWLLATITIALSAIDAYFAIFRPDIRQSVIGLIGSISGLSMALLIWHAVLKFKLAESQSWLSICLQRTGRMAFTLYILQSLVMAGLFRYCFPQWNETFTLTDYTLVGVSFILFQMLLANSYLAHFKQGPLEKLWRHLVNKTKAKQQDEQQSKQPEQLSAKA